MSEIVLAASDAAFEGVIRSAFADSLNGELLRLDDLNVDSVLAEEPSVVALGPSWASDELIAAAAEIDRRRPEITVVLFAEPNADLWQQALRSGARDLVDPAADPEQLRETIDRARDRSIRQRRNVRAEVATDTPSESGGRRTRVITVMSPKGGSGKTMLATNLAFGLAGRHPGTVALVDLDLQFGDVATALRLAPEYSMAHAVTHPEDPAQVKSNLTAHPAGFWALCAPGDPVVADDLTSDQVGAVLECLRAEFDWLVLDTGAGMDDHTLTALEYSTDVVLTTTTDVAAIHSIRKAVDVLDHLGLDPAAQHVVLNRANARVGLSVDDIERTVGRRVEARIPSARLVPTSMNEGSPVLEDNGRSGVGRAINGVIDLLTETAGVRTSRRSLLKGGRS